MKKVGWRVRSRGSARTCTSPQLMPYGRIVEAARWLIAQGVKLVDYSAVNVVTSTDAKTK